jgi:hypothetical protein
MNDVIVVQNEDELLLDGLESVEQVRVMAASGGVSRQQLDCFSTGRWKQGLHRRDQIGGKCDQIAVLASSDSQALGNAQVASQALNSVVLP